MHTVELYRKVRLACRDGMSERAAARHFGVSRQSVRKMLQFSELLSRVVFARLNQAAIWSSSITSIPSLNLIPVTTFAR